MALGRKKTEIPEYEQRIRKHRRQKLTIIGTILGVVVVICVFLINAYINRVFNAYRITATVDRKESNGTQYMSYKNMLLKYSKDGASVIDSSGNTVWNGSYNMNNPQVDICGDYVAIADIGGYDIQVFNGSDSGTPIKVTQPILQVEVAKQGVVAVLQEGEDNNVFQIINPYNTAETLLIDRKTYVEKDGVPVNIAFSEDGTKLVTSYVDIKKGVIQSFITFYNFSEVGQNASSNRIVGMKDYGSSVIAKVEFLGNDTVAVYGEHEITLFDMKEIQEEKKKISFEQEIKSTFHTDSYLGFVLEGSSKNEKYKLVVYDLSGNKVLDKKIDFNYDKVFMNNKEIIFQSNLSCEIIKLNGVTKFSYTFNAAINGIFPINHYNQYFFINGATIDIVKLTEE